MPENNNALVFTALRIIRMPGISPPGITLENLKPGVNIIHGPNAAGKTTVSKALNALLWPTKSVAERALINGNFTLDDENWFVKTETGSRSFQRKSSPAPPPPLPGHTAMDRYNLALHHLLQEETTDRGFAELIVQELSGGYDIPLAASQLGFTDSPSGVGSKTRKAKSSVAELEKIKSELQELETTRQELKQLRRRREETDKARRRAVLLEQLLEVKKCRRKHEEIKEKLKQYPETMEKVTGSELEQLEEINREISELEKENDDSQKKRDLARETLAGLKYPYQKAVDGKVSELELQTGRLSELEDDIDRHNNELQASLKKQREEARYITENNSKKNIDDFGRTVYDELSEFAKQAETVHNKLESLDKLKGLLETAEDKPAGEIKRACELLENWLSFRGETVRETSYRRALIGLATVAAGFIVATGLYIPWLLGLLILPLAGLWYGWPGGPEEKIRKKLARREFEELKLAVAPENWQPEEVRKALRGLYELRAREELARQKEEYWHHYREEYEALLERKQELEEKRETLIEKFGFAPDSDERKLYWLTNRLSRWQDARSEAAQWEEKLNLLKKDYQKLLDELNGELSRWDFEGEEAGGAAQSAIEARKALLIIKKRLAAFKEATGTLEQSEERLERIKKRLPELKNKKTQLFKKFKLKPGDEASLRELVGQLEDYQEICREESNSRAIYESKRDELQELDGYQPEMEERVADEISSELDKVRKTAEEHEQVNEKITTIQTRIDEAKKRYDYEPALARKQRNFESLEEQLEEDYEKMAGNVLSRYLQDVNTDPANSPVFDRARRILTTIASGRFQLEIEQTNPPSFRIIDTSTGEGKGLDELSSGTRLQVLIAVRLAFVEEAEGRYKLPLYMDETLANADDERARAIIESVFQLARAGRQIFYFTAQGDEVAKWQATAGLRDEKLNIIDLVQHTKHKLEGTVEIPDPEEIKMAGETVPESSGLSHEEYGQKLDVPPFDPRRPAGLVHLWYLVEDTALLEDLLRKNIKSWGQLKTLLEQGRTALIASGNRGAIEKIRQLGRATEVFIKNWRYGQNRRIDRTVLNDSGAISENFIDEVTELTDECGGEPEKLLEKLRAGDVNRFRSDKIEELEQYLIENNYIDRSEPLDPQTIRAAVISSLDKSLFDSPAEQTDTLLERLKNTPAIS